MQLANFKNWRSIGFRRKDNSVLTLSIPTQLDQSDLKLVNRKEYLFFRLKTPGNLPQSAIVEIKRGKNTIGYLIPGQTILLNARYKKDNKRYSTYNLLIAMEICERSWKGDYSLCAPKHESATGISDIFEQEVYYGVVWSKPLDATGRSIPDQYLLSFLANDYFIFNGEGNSPVISFTDGAYSDELRLIKNKDLPPYFGMLFGELIPYTENNILRFFYVYQAIEILMAKYLDEKYDEIKNALISTEGINKTTLRKKISELSDASKEKPRINSILQNEDEKISQMIIEGLSHISDEFNDLAFSEKVYHLRNILFHDYTKLHTCGEAIGCIANELASYLIKKLQNTDQTNLSDKKS